MMNNNTTTSKIVKTKRNEDGGITNVMLEDGIILPINHAVLMAKNNLLEDISVTKGKNGGEFIKSHSKDILAKLPTFKD